jgi:hypothetical protein
MPKYTEEERKARTLLSWKMYIQLERDMIDYLDYVPLDEKHLEVYSPKLIAIIIQVGPEIISGFDVAVANLNKYVKIAKEFEGSDLPSDLEALWKHETELKTINKSISFKRYYDFLEKHCYNKPSSALVEYCNKPSSALVEIKESSYVFSPLATQPPEWWDVYNRLKHDKYTNLKKATLKIALDSLGALFWIQSLNMDEVYGQTKIDSQLFNRKN